MDLGNNVQLLSINSIHLCHRNLPLNDIQAPKFIFAWILEKFSEARKTNKKLILTYHIPQGLFATAVGVETFWVKKYEDNFNALLRKYKDNIIGIYTGHTHVSGVNATVKDHGSGKEYYAGVVVNRAVSPHYTNNPGFAVFRYGDDLKHPLYYDEYTFDIEKSYDSTEPSHTFWSHLYNSKKDMNIADLSPKGIMDFLDSLEADVKKYLKYILFRLGMKPYEYEQLNQLIEDVCTERTTKKAEYFKCVNALRFYMKQGMR
eukprot:TRINITY_DN1791_c0_g2_i1.p2 TRINITY_DN1791_c0_g2~~TRINITY_DN1791_c0_g2_i1.p2  ORF type:complete len:260 (+),score=59.60 TRINITY_DN1791_c0_g2_i1:1511-2290(+)